MDRPDALNAAKLALRDQVGTARRRLGPLQLVEAAHALADHLLAAPEVRRAATLTAYVSVGHEPGTGPLLDALAEAGKRILLPVVLRDLDLDWAVYAGPDTLAPARRGLLEPTGPRLGVEAVAAADCLLVPGAAVDRRGVRLGQGGGCFDRALARVPADRFVCVLLHEHEVVESVPESAHDRRVTAAATPRGVHRFTAGG